MEAPKRIAGHLRRAAPYVVRALLSQDPGVEVVGEADNGRDAIRAASQLAPHLVLMDMNMPSGSSASRQSKTDTLGFFR